jgi:hypothetical protein
MTNLLTYALTNLADVKESLGIASGIATYDNLVRRKINQATEMIETYCDRRFLSTVYTDEEYDGTGIDELRLNQYPITAFTSLSVRDTPLNESDWETTDSELYFVDLDTGILRLLFNAGGRWGRYKVTYTAGYTAANLPQDLTEACVVLACYLVNTSPTMNSLALSGVKSKREGQRSIEYDVGILGSDQLFKRLGIFDSIAAYADIR